MILIKNNETGEERTILPNEHYFSPWVAVRFIKENGIQYKKCSKCGEKGVFEYT